MQKRPAADIASVRFVLFVVCALHFPHHLFLTWLPVENMLDYVPGVRLVPTKSSDVWRSALRKVKQWVYSWMKPGYVECKDKLKVSKFLLLQFVRSGAFMSAACSQAELVIATLRFLQCHVFVHESLYLHYLRCFVWHFDASHGSPHEGTNFGIKNHAAPVQPTMNLDTSSTNLNLQANLKAAELDAKLHVEFANTHKLWSDSPSAPYLLSFGEALMVAENLRTEDKTTQRVGSSVFEVTYTPKTDAPSLDETVD